MNLMSVSHVHVYSLTVLNDFCFIWFGGEGVHESCYMSVIWDLFGQ
jgi:hypothetical protein